MSTRTHKYGRQANNFGEEDDEEETGYSYGSYVDGATSYSYENDDGIWLFKIVVLLHSKYIYFKQTIPTTMMNQEATSLRKNLKMKLLGLVKWQHNVIRWNRIKKNFVFYFGKNIK